MGFLKSTIKGLRETYCDLSLGIKTKGIIFPDIYERNPDCTPSYPTPYPMLERVLTLPLPNNKVLMDFGMGAGRAVFYFAKANIFSKIIGVEIQDKVFIYAQANYKKTICTIDNIELVHASVLDVSIDHVDVFFFAHPFEGEFLDRVIDKIENSLDLFPREIHIIYVDPLSRSAFTSRARFEEVAFSGDDKLAVSLIKNINL